MELKALLDRYLKRFDRFLAWFIIAFIVVLFLQDLYWFSLVWLALPLGTLVWFLCRASSSNFYKAIAETLLPWVIGWAIVVVTYLIVLLCLPKAQWSWILLVEKAASLADVTLDKVLPHSIIVNVVLLAFLFAISVLRPSWKKLTQRFQKILSGAKTVAAVIAVFTGVTFFGDGQLGRIIEATAQEKFDRLNDQAAARVELILAARVTEKPHRESDDVHKYLDAVYAAVSQDIHIYPVSYPYERRVKMSEDQLRLWRRMSSAQQRLIKLVSIGSLTCAARSPKAQPL